MTPLRMAVHIKTMSAQQNTTPAQIKAMLAAYKASALNTPDGPLRGHDIAYYADIITAIIVTMETSIPPWSSADIKQQLMGRIVALIPTGV